MLKTLSESSLATYTPYEGVRLTPAGTALALRVIRRHRLIELFLVKTLNLAWDEVHEEAEHMEHAVSDRLIDRIDAFLGHPDTDPHGDPIPRRDGSVASAEVRTLAACPVGKRFRLATGRRPIARVPALSGQFGLGLGGQRIGHCKPDRQPASSRSKSKGSKRTLGRQAAEKILVGDAESD